VAVRNGWYALALIEQMLPESRAALATGEFDAWVFFYLGGDFSTDGKLLVNSDRGRSNSK
jgi:hypothetical protein